MPILLDTHSSKIYLTYISLAGANGVATGSSLAAQQQQQQ